MKKILENTIENIRKYPHAQESEILKMLKRNDFEYNLGLMVELNNYLDLLDSLDPRQNDEYLINKWGLDAEDLSEMDTWTDEDMI